MTDMVMEVAWAACTEAVCTAWVMEDMAATAWEAMVATAWEAMAATAWEDMAACKEVAMVVAMDHTAWATAWAMEDMAAAWAMEDMAAWATVAVWDTVVVVITVATADLEDTVCIDQPSRFNYENQSFKSLAKNQILSNQIILKSVNRKHILNDIE